MALAPTDRADLSSTQVSAWIDHLGLRNKAVITTQEAATVLRVSEKSVRQGIREGEIPAVRVGKRVLIPVPMLVHMLVGHELTE